MRKLKPAIYKSVMCKLCSYNVKKMCLKYIFKMFSFIKKHLNIIFYWCKFNIPILHALL